MSDAAPAAPRAKSGNAQILRFVAAALVLVGHSEHEAVGLGLIRDGPIRFHWGIGVDIFFVISGFVIFHSARALFGAPRGWAIFLGRRLRRIVPVYWLFATLTLVALEAASHGRYAVTAMQIAASYVFLPWPDAAARMQPILRLGWTLNYEMLFYAIFALALLLPRPRGLIAAVAAMILLAALHPLVPPALFVLRFWTDPILLEFLGGIAVGALFERGVRLPPAASLPLAAVILLAHVPLVAALPPLGSDWRALVFGVPMTIASGLVILAHEGREGRARRWLAHAGDASYALYLSHAFTIALLAAAWARLRPPGGAAAYLGVALSGSIAVSLATYRWVEKPIGAAWSRRRRGATPAAARA